MLLPGLWESSQSKSDIMVIWWYGDMVVQIFILFMIG